VIIIPKGTESHKWIFRKNFLIVFVWVTFGTTLLISWLAKNIQHLVCESSVNSW